MARIEQNNMFMLSKGAFLLACPMMVNFSVFVFIFGLCVRVVLVNTSVRATRLLEFSLVGQGCLWQWAERGP